MKSEAFALLFLCCPAAMADISHYSGVNLPARAVTATEGRNLQSLWLRATRLGHEAEMAAVGGEESRARELGQQSLEIWNRIQRSYLEGSKDASSFGRSDAIAKIVAQILAAKSRIRGDILNDHESARIELAEAVSWTPTDEELKMRLDRALARGRGTTVEYSKPSANALPQTEQTPLTPLPPVIGVIEEIADTAPETN